MLFKKKIQLVWWYGRQSTQTNQGGIAILHWIRDPWGVHLNASTLSSFNIDCNKPFTLIFCHLSLTDELN
jgi:hypothetical protein